MNEPMYDAVLAMLEARKGEWRQIAEDSGVPYSSLCKIAQKHIPSPSVHVIQNLFDFLSARSAPSQRKVAAA